MAETRRDRLDQPRERRGPRLLWFDPEAFGRWSEGIARFMGTARFLVYMTVFILAWIIWLVVVAWWTKESSRAPTR